MNGQAMADRCAFRFGDTTHEVIDDTEWLAYLNEAYSAVVADDPFWPFLEVQNSSLSVTAGTGTVALPADTWRVSSVYSVTDKWPLSPIPGRAAYRSWFPDPANNLGTPGYYRLQGAVLEVYPWPAATTTLAVNIATPPAAITLATEPLFPEQYHMLLVHGALAQAYEDDESQGMAQSHNARYERLLQGMKTDLLSSRDEGFHPVIDVF